MWGKYGAIHKFCSLVYKKYTYSQEFAPCLYFPHKPNSNLLVKLQAFARLRTDSTLNRKNLRLACIFPTNLIATCLLKCKLLLACVRIVRLPSKNLRLACIFSTNLIATCLLNCKPLLACVRIVRLLARICVKNI